MSGVLTHYQAGKPVHWALRNDVDLPGVRHLSGSIARVFEILRLAQETAHCFRVGQGMAPAGWVPVWVFREPWAGGSAGDRRLRDLRRLGVELEGKPYDADGSGSSSWIWRLGPASGTSPSTRRPNPREKPTGPKAQVSAEPLSGVSVRLCVARPVLYTGDLVDLSPGMPHVAAPTASLAQRVAEGTLSAAEAQEAYRQHLLAAYRGGELASAFRAGTALTVCCDAPFDALAVLGRALTKLGATIAAAAETAG